MRLNQLYLNSNNANLETILGVLNTLTLGVILLETVAVII